MRKKWKPNKKISQLKLTVAGPRRLRCELLTPLRSFTSRVYGFDILFCKNQIIVKFMFSPQSYVAISSPADYARIPDINKIQSPNSLDLSQNINLITTYVWSFKSRRITYHHDKPMNRSLLPRLIVHPKTGLIGRQRHRQRGTTTNCRDLFTMTNPRTEACSLPSMAHPITMLLALIRSSLRTFTSHYHLKIMSIMYSTVHCHYVPSQAFII